MPRSLTISYQKSRAEERGFLFLESEYRGDKVKHSYKCPLGHTFDIAPHNFNQGQGCSFCGGTRKLDLAGIKALGLSRGLNLLDKEYKGYDSLHNWRCFEFGHVLSLTVNAVKQNGGCKICNIRRGASLRRTSVSDLQALAASKGGMLLSTSYTRWDEKLEWQCASGHRWFAIISNISKGKAWCRQCATEAKRAYDDPGQKRIARRLRTRLNHALHGRGVFALEYLGCTLPVLRTHLESQWQPGMTWESYGNLPGKWNIDHVKPLASFDLSDPEECARACHYTNLQPMWALENSAKGAREATPCQT